MPLLAEGVYVESTDTAYETECTYYLNFHIVSAIASIEKLREYCPAPVWENRCQYFHYYTDHLLFSLGQIANRLVITDNDKGLSLERKKCNRGNYLFSEEHYPILSDKRARNMMEHIDERNQKIIKDQSGVGGFNVIEADTPPELAERLRTRTDLQPYTLDWVNFGLIVRDKSDDIFIDLDQLMEELSALRKSVQSFKEISASIFF